MDNEPTEEFLVFFRCEGLLYLRFELFDHFEMFSQISRQDILDEHLSEFAEVFLIYVDQDIAVIILNDFYCCCSMVLFEYTFIMVPYG